MREAKLTINLMKSELGKATVKYLGHIVGQGQVRPLDAKIQTVVKFPIPTSWTEFVRFLGMAGYYKNFCLNFSEIAAPLTNLLSKKVKFVLTYDCQLAFDKVKLLLQKSPVLKSPDYEMDGWNRSPCQLFFQEIHKISKKLISGGKRNIGQNKNQKLVRWSLALQEYNL